MNNTKFCNFSFSKRRGDHISDTTRTYTLNSKYVQQVQILSRQTGICGQRKFFSFLLIPNSANCLSASLKFTLCIGPFINNKRNPGNLLIR